MAMEQSVIGYKHVYQFRSIPVYLWTLRFETCTSPFLCLVHALFSRCKSVSWIHVDIIIKIQSLCLSWWFYAVFSLILFYCKILPFPYLFSFDEPISISDLGLNHDFAYDWIRGKVWEYYLFGYMWLVELMA